MTRQRITKVWHLLAWFTVGILSSSMAVAQNAAPPSIAEQLQAQYQLAKIGSDSSGYAVIKEGTLLDVQKGGILGTPWGSTKSCPSKYANSQLQQASTLCSKGREQAVKHGFGILGRHLPGAAAENVSDANTSADTHLFKIGDKVYPTKINVDMKDEKVAFSIVACDTCNKTDPATYNKSEVDFQFDEGFLEKGDVSKIEDTIGEVFSLDNSSSQGGQAGQDQGQAQTSSQAAGPAQPQATPAPAPAGPTLSNDDVIKLVQAKMSDSIIIKKIKNSACSFDTSADGLVKLKQAGVSEEVIEAMVDKP
jgi:hypothetical protein